MKFKERKEVGMSEQKEKCATVTTVKARDFEVECPYCGHVAEGWVRDPRGTPDTCDGCGKSYLIAGNAEVRFA